MIEEFENVKTYIGLCQKYPEAREDLLNLRRQKNTALYFLIVVSFCIGGLVVWIIK